MKIEKVRVLTGYRLELVFQDGFAGIVDLSGLVEKGVFKKIADARSFGKVKIGSHGGLEWEDGLDLCPDALYLEASWKSVKELFPSLKSETAQA